MIILIVEDNLDTRRILADMVRAAFQPASILEASDAVSAVILCRITPPDLILTDVNLPGINGIMLTAQIKSMLPRSTVVIVSNYRSHATQEAAIAAGAAAYVFKDEIDAKLLPTLALVLRPPQKPPQTADAAPPTA